MRYGRFLAASAAIVALGLTLLTPEAQAFDRKGYSGNNCQTYFARDTGLVDHQIRGVLNTSTSGGVYVSCPIVRDNSFDANGPGGSLWVAVNRSNATSEAMYCWLLTLNQAGIIIRSQRSPLYTGTGPVWLGMTISGTNYSQAWASYMMWCRVPAQSNVIYYNVYERTPTDGNN